MLEKFYLNLEWKIYFRREIRYIYYDICLVYYISYLIGYFLILEKIFYSIGVDFSMKDIRIGNGFFSVTDSYDTVFAVD